MGDSDSDSDDKTKKEKKDVKKDEADAKKSEADKAKRQQEATLAVLACFQKLSDVNLENFDTVKAEYDKVMATELPDTGAQQEVLKAQAEQAFGYAETYISKLKGGSEDKKKSDDKSKKDEEKRRKEKEKEKEKERQEEEDRKAKEE